MQDLFFQISRLLLDYVIALGGAGIIAWLIEFLRSLGGAG